MAVAGLNVRHKADDISQGSEHGEVYWRYQLHLYPFFESGLLADTGPRHDGPRAKRGPGEYFVSLIISFWCRIFAHKPHRAPQKQQLTQEPPSSESPPQQQRRYTLRSPGLNPCHRNPATQGTTSSLVGPTYRSHCSSAG